MLTRKEIEERLEHPESCCGCENDRDRERAALQTAQQLAEWLEAFFGATDEYGEREHDCDMELEVVGWIDGHVG